MSARRAVAILLATAAAFSALTWFVPGAPVGAQTDCGDGVGCPDPDKGRN